MGNLKRISYAAPSSATVTVNPLGEVSSTTDNGKGFGSDDGYMDVLDIFNGKK